MFICFEKKLQKLSSFFVIHNLFSIYSKILQFVHAYNHNTFQTLIDLEKSFHFFWSCLHVFNFVVFPYSSQTLEAKYLTTNTTWTILIRVLLWYVHKLLSVQVLWLWFQLRKFYLCRHKSSDKSCCHQSRANSSMYFFHSAIASNSLIWIEVLSIIFWVWHTTWAPSSSIGCYFQFFFCSFL